MNCAREMGCYGVTIRKVNINRVNKFNVGKTFDVGAYMI